MRAAYGGGGLDGRGGFGIFRNGTYQFEYDGGDRAPRSFVTPFVFRRAYFYEHRGFIQKRAVMRGFHSNLVSRRFSGRKPGQGPLKQKSRSRAKPAAASAEIGGGEVAGRVRRKRRDRRGRLVARSENKIFRLDRAVDIFGENGIVAYRVKLSGNGVMAAYRRAVEISSAFDEPPRIQEPPFNIQACLVGGADYDGVL